MSEISRIFNEKKGTEEITRNFNTVFRPPASLTRPIQSRHKNIETTLLYDHSTLEIAKEFFNKKQRKNIDDFNLLDLSNLKSDDKARMWMEKYLANEIDVNTFIAGMDVLLPGRRKHKQEGDDLGYL